MDKSSAKNSTSDSKSFIDTNLDSKIGIIVGMLVLIFIGFIIFFQICCTQITASGGSGIVGSIAKSSGEEEDDGTYDNTCAGIGQFIAILIIAGGTAALLYAYTTKINAEKLANSKNLIAARELNPKPGTSLNVDLVVEQITNDVAFANKNSIPLENIPGLPVIQEESSESESSESEQEESKRSRSRKSSSKSSRKSQSASSRSNK